MTPLISKDDPAAQGWAREWLPEGHWSGGTPWRWPRPGQAMRPRLQQPRYRR